MKKSLRRRRLLPRWRGSGDSLQSIGRWLRRENLRMDNVGENLETIDQTRPGTAKKGVPVDGVNFAGFDGRQLVPAFESLAKLRLRSKFAGRRSRRASIRSRRARAPQLCSKHFRGGFALSTQDIMAAR